MKLEQALTILGLSEIYTNDDLNKRYIQLSLDFSVEELAQEVGRNKFAAIKEAYQTLSNKTVNAAETVTEYLNRLTHSRVDLYPHQIKIPGETRFDEAMTLYLTVPVDARFFSLDFNAKDLDLVSEVAVKGRYWLVSSNKTDKPELNLMTLEGGESLRVFSALQVNGIFSSDKNPVRLIPEFYQYEFSNITPRKMIDAFFNGDVKALVPHLSSVTSQYVSEVEQEHYEALTKLFEESKEGVPGTARKISQYVAEHLKYVRPIAEPKEYSMDIGPESKTRILTRMYDKAWRMGFFDGAPTAPASTGTGYATASTASIDPRL